VSQKKFLFVFFVFADMKMSWCEQGKMFQNQ